MGFRFRMPAITAIRSVLQAGPSVPIIYWRVVWLVWGLGALFAYRVCARPPLGVLVCLIAATTVAGVITVRTSRLSFLPRLMILLYALPFSATAGYLFFANYVWWTTTLHSQYCEDHELMSELLFSALVGLSGLIMGIVYGPVRPRRLGECVAGSHEAPPYQRTLPYGPFFLLLVLSLFFSWLHMPEKTIFSAAYGNGDQGTSFAIKSSFYASYLVSYLILILLFIDTEREPAGSPQRRTKMKAVLSATAFIVVVIQLLHGDRESSGLICGLAALHLTAPDFGRGADFASMHLGKFRRIAVPLMVLVALFYVLGLIRSKVSDAGFTGARFCESFSEAYRKNTWTAVALTNLGLARDVRNDKVEYLYGQTYLDYVYSLPPGFVARAMDLKRPIDRDSGPACWYNDLSRGGIHVLIVPYRNFGIVGVFAVMSIYGALIACCEAGNVTGRFWMRLLFGTVATCSFLWFWYGDMNIIRGLTTSLALGLFYNCFSRCSMHITMANGSKPRTSLEIDQPHDGNNSDEGRRKSTPPCGLD